MAGRAELASDLQNCGVRDGMTLLVHTSLRAVGPIDGGAQTLLAAFTDVLGTDGTLVVPTFTTANSQSSSAFRAKTRHMSSTERARFLDQMPPFDPLTTRSEGVGWFAECVRTAPGAVRSPHPQTSFAAVGANAETLMREHAPECQLGEVSPLGRLYAADAAILMIGCGYGSCTAFHLAEYRYSETAPRQVYACVVAENDLRGWRTFVELKHDDSDFPKIGAALEAGVDARVTAGDLGQAPTKMVSLRQAVDFAVGWMSQNRS